LIAALRRMASASSMPMTSTCWPKPSHPSRRLRPPTNPNTKTEQIIAYYHTVKIIRASGIVTKRFSDYDQEKGQFAPHG
jgi:hypothetical protein